MVHYEVVKITINIGELAPIIIDILIKHHGLLELIISDRGSLFTSKFWSLLRYFFRIKYRLLTAFNPETNSQTKWQNSIMKVYLRVFVNFEQKD